MKDLVVVLIGQHEGPRITLALSDQKHAENTQNKIFENSERRNVCVFVKLVQLSIYLLLNLLLNQI